MMRLLLIKISNIALVCYIADFCCIAYFYPKDFIFSGLIICLPSAVYRCSIRAA